jgi:outer membrane protein assembly factor BamE (lipoprotein component of BamABCDE complex)
MTATIRSLSMALDPLARCGRRIEFALPVLLALMVEGCMTLEYGVMPQTDRLDELSIGESRQGDVLLVLGQPRGKGAADVSPEYDRRTIWFYEYVESDGQAVRLKMLLVYFVGDVYDGHLWFSSVGDIS